MLKMLVNTPVARFALGLDHRITFWNEACEALTGYPATRMIGTDLQWKPFYNRKRPVLADLVLQNDFCEFVRLYRSPHNEPSSLLPRAWEGIASFDNIGGLPRRLHFLAGPVHDIHGNVIGVVETLIDITHIAEPVPGMPGQNLFRGPSGLFVPVSKEPSLCGKIIGRSRAMQEVYELIVRAGATAVNVIIYGESGTGKELVARAIHDMSARHGKNFVAVNCGAIPEALFESEFFGYCRGAFTGAHTDKPGFLDLADGGTLFLDEIAELPPSMQVKLLRVLDGSGYMPLGGNVEKKADLRVIAATNKNLPDLVAAGAMRDDFFYRVHIIPVHLPPLRKRGEDLPLLIDYFLADYGKEKVSSIPENIRQQLCNYDWPGNIRELQNVLRRYFALNRLDFGSNAMPSDPSHFLSAPNKPDTVGLLHRLRDDAEKEGILSALQSCNWNRNQAAELLGISRQTLFRRMKKHRLA